MGEVYEAEDLELRERVALKTIGRAVADDERAMERFRREVQLSRRVTHGNVCRIFDIFRQGVTSPDPARPDAGIAFLTMELLTGETLAEKLDRVGRIAPLRRRPRLPESDGKAQTELALRRPVRDVDNGTVRRERLRTISGIASPAC